MKYQNKYGISDSCDEKVEQIRKSIVKLFKEQETIEDIQSLKLLLFSTIAGEGSRFILQKGLEMRKAERNERKNNG